MYVAIAFAIPHNKCQRQAIKQFPLQIPAGGRSTAVN
jgi:hypothetical protein